jgi:hypothetical protein
MLPAVVKDQAERMFANYYSLRAQLASLASLLIGTILFAMLVVGSGTSVLDAAVSPSPSPADKHGCGYDQYITRDLVGDSNPAEVLASLCGS